MVKLQLTAKALLDNVTGLRPLDTPQTPHEYVFRIQCTACRETHDKPVLVNRFEKHALSGSRGDASFVFRCRNCRLESSAQVLPTEKEVLESWTPVLDIDARGLEPVDFVPQGRWMCSGSKGAVFDNVDLEDREWFDYNEAAAEEVLVTEVEFAIVRV